MAGESIDRLSPEFALVEALRSVPVLLDDSGDPKVAAMQPKKGWKPPFAFYVPTVDSEDEALDGPTGLQHFAAQLHFVGGTHRGMQLLCLRAKKALTAMQGAVYSTDPADGEPGGSILAESVNLQQVSADLHETEVSYYRRVYTVQIDYQTEEVHEEVPSA